jgi:hypothetical protein
MQSLIKRCIRLPYFPIIIAPILLFSGTLLTGRILFWGLPMLQFYPWREFAWESLTHGLLPLWNPFNGMGAPLIANYQLALFYPPGWLVYLFAIIGGSQLMAWSHTLLVVLHLIWAGIGMVFFARSLGLGELAQTISGLAFSLSGYLVARNSFFSIIWAAAWLPWIMYSVNELVKQEKLKFSFPLLFFIVFQLLAGHAQLTWYSLLLASLWIVIFCWVYHGAKRALGGGLIFGLTMIIGVGLTAIQLFPTAEFLLQSQRSGAVNYDLGLTYSFWPWRLLNLLSPDFFGNPGSGTYFGYAAYWEDAIYFGLIPMVLSLSTLKHLFKRRKYSESGQATRAAVLWILVVVAFIFALGKNTPIFPWLYLNVPTFGLFNAPARWMVGAVFGLSALAGIGAEAWKAPVGKVLRNYRIGLVITVAVALGAGITFLVLKEVKLSFIQATAIAGLWGAVYCLLAIKMPKSEAGRKAWTYIFIGVVVVDLISAQWSLVPTSPANVVIPSPGVTSLPDNQRVYLSYQDEYNLKFQRFFHIDDFTPLESWSNIWKTQLPNTNLSGRVEYVNNFDPLLPDRYSTLINFLDQLSPEMRDPWLKLMNVGAVEEIDPRTPDGVKFTPAQTQGRFQWFACAEFAMRKAEAWDMTQKLVANSRSDLVVLEGEKFNQPCSANKSADIQVLLDQPESVIIKITASQEDSGGWLFMADTWYPGWIAAVDGIETPIYRADYAFRAIQVNGGQHIIKFEYQPKSFFFGVAISAVSWIIILIFILITRIHFSFRYKL